MRKYCLLITVLLALGTSGCNNEPSHQSLENSCYEKGLAYMTAIGSYPHMKSEPYVGRWTVEVVRERCERTINAFKDLPHI